MSSTRTCAIAAIVFLFSWTLTTHGKFSVSGDEPHYLMIAESLRSDHDLDVANNYAQDDGRLFGHENLPIELHAIRAPNGETRSIHAVGLPVFLLPLYATAQRLAPLIDEEHLKAFQMGRGLFIYSIVSTFLIALTSIGVALMSAGLATIGGARRATIVGIAVGVSPPILSHSFLIFPEVFALFVTCCVVWFVTRSPRPTDRLLIPLLMLAIGVLPWFHQKYLVYTPGLLIVIWRRRGDLLRTLPAPDRMTAAAAFVLPQAAVLLWLNHEWGSFGGALTIGAIATQNIPLTADSLAHGAVGLLFDRQSGLAAFAPLVWVIPACVALTWRRTIDVLAPVALLYLPAAAFVIGWWAGFSPAARYLVPAIPLLTIPAMLALEHRAVRGVAWGLLGAQLVINAIVWQHPRWLWPSTGDNRVLPALGWPGKIYERLVPNIRAEGLTVDALIPIVGMVALTAAVVFAERRASSHEQSVDENNRNRKHGC